MTTRPYLLDLMEAAHREGGMDAALKIAETKMEDEMKIAIIGTEHLAGVTTAIACAIIAYVLGPLSWKSLTLLVGPIAFVWVIRTMLIARRDISARRK